MPCSACCPPGLRCGISGTAGRWLGSARCWGLRSISSSIRGCWPSGWAACRKKLSWPCWGQLIWAVALACAVWLLLGALHRRSLNTSSLLHGMQIGLCLLDGAFVVSVFGVGVLDLRGQIAAVRQANTMLDNTAFGTLNPTALFLVCGWLVQSLPALLNLGIVHGLLQLVKLAKADRFAPGMAQAAAHCGTLAGGAAAVDVTVQAVFLAVQLCAAGQLHQLNSGLHIALLPVLFAVAALLFSRWLAEGCALREENEGFI